jgi:branched-chain amino acid transport system ATP-binding protein
MDEPSLGLSPKLIRDYFETIRLIHSQGTTVLLIEQNAEMALRVADRGYILSRGRIVASDRAAALRASSVVRNLYFS